MTILTETSNESQPGLAPPPDIFQSLLLRKGTIFIAVLCGIFVAAIGAYFMDRAWRSEVLLVVNKGDEDSSSLAGLSGQLGGISALAGISVSTDSTHTEYMATLKSTGLARTFFHQGTVAADFCKGQVIECKGLTPEQPIPEELLYKMVRKFQNSVLDVEEDKISGLVRVSVTWPDRFIAAQWANGIVAEANKQLQNRKIQDARNRLGYLSESVRKTDLVPLRDAISRLMEGQVKTEMMAETRAEYAFRTVDAARPSASFDYVRPRRAIMMACGAVLGFLTVAVWTAMRPPSARTV